MANLKQSEFFTKAALHAELGRVLGSVMSTGEYSVYLHKVYDFDSEGKRYGDICARTNFNGIMERGLSLSKYSSLQQTSVYHGDMDKDTVNDVLAYNYPWPTTEHIVLILALPKNIDVYGKNINFSTPIFRFAEYGIMGDDRGEKNQYTMAFDGLRYYSVDTPLILGAIVTHLPTETEEDFAARGGKYELILNMDHISQVPLDIKEETMGPIRERMVQKFGLESTDTEEEMEGKVRSSLIEQDKYNAMAGTHDDFYDFD